MTAAALELPAAVRTFLARAAHSVFVDGSGTAGDDGAEIDTLDPASGTRIGAVAAGTSSDVDRIVASAKKAFPAWRALSPAARGRILLDVAALIEDHAEELATIETLDNGKPMTESLYLDIALAAQTWRHFAGARLSGQVLPASPPVGDAFVYSRREPLGVVGAIVPWNFPIMIASWKLAPALAAGNTVVLKPSEMTSLSALRLVELAHEAGLPPGVLNMVTGYGHEAGKAMTEHQEIAKISFTGSTATGRRIVAASGGNFKKLTLELGGKSANIVFDDADLASAAQGALNGIFMNQGQVCCAGSRLFVHRSVHDKFVAELADAACRIQLGHGLAEDTEMGPLISETHLGKVLDYVDAGVREGATLVCGGRRAQGGLAAGYFVEPAVFTDVADQMAIATDEIFGPVLAVLPFDDEAEVVRRANASDYGLAAGLWTESVKRAHRVADQLDAGTVWVNMYNMIDPAVPFGGYKKSGHGRDLGEESLLSYTQTKSVWVSLD